MGHCAEFMKNAGASGVHLVSEMSPDQQATIVLVDICFAFPGRAVNEKGEVIQRTVDTVFNFLGRNGRLLFGHSGTRLLADIAAVRRTEIRDVPLFVCVCRHALFDACLMQRWRIESRICSTRTRRDPLPRSYCD